MAGGFTFSGKLETTSFPEIAGAVYRLGKSGELKVTTGKRSRTVWFLDGNPVAVTSDDPRDHLARVLEESGKITADEAGRLEKFSEEKDSLQGIDFVPRELLMWGLKSRFVQLCYDIFRWTDGEYRFQEAVPPKKLPLLKVPTPTMILKGVAYLPPAYLRRRVPAKGTLEQGAVPPEEAVYLSMEERVFLEACREGGEAGEATGSAQNPEEARRRIFAFLALGLLSLRPPLHEAEEPEPLEPPVMELTEEAIIPPPREVIPPTVPLFRPAAPPPAPVSGLADDEGFGEEPILPATPRSAPPLQGELPYQGIGVRIAPEAPKRRSVFLPLQKRGLWLVVAGFGVVLLVALWRVFALLTTPDPTPGVPLTRVFPTPRPTVVVAAAASPIVAGEPLPATPPPVPPPPTPAATAVPVVPTVAPTIPTAPRTTAAIARPEARTPASPPSSPAAQGVNVDRYREGLDVYRAGDLRKAAELWAALSSGGRLGEYTVQIEVACSPETITKDFPPLERLGEPFLLPRAVKGRACYALCLGRFPSKDEAEALLKGLPASYVKDGATVKSIRLLTGQ